MNDWPMLVDYVLGLAFHACTYELLVFCFKYPFSSRCELGVLICGNVSFLGFAYGNLKAS